MDDDNRVIIERYPAEKLPDEWRKGRELGAEVRIVIERAPEANDDDAPLTRIVERMQDRRVLSEDPVVRIRALRAGWDHRDELHDRIRKGDA